PIRTGRGIKGLEAANRLETESLEEFRLCATARTPRLEMPSRALLIDRGRDGRQTKSGATLPARTRHERFVPDPLGEVVEDRRAIDQVLSIVQHQDRDLPHWIEHAGTRRIGIAIEVVVLIRDGP